MREREGGKETLICCSTYLCMHWLMLACALPRDQIHNLGAPVGEAVMNCATRPGLEILQSTIWEIAHCLGTSSLLGPHCHLRNVGQRTPGVNLEGM